MANEAEARRSYELRLNRLKRAERQLSEANQELSLLFDVTFKHPDAARAKFAGEFQILNGPNREKELALENLNQISVCYRKAEEAQSAKLLAERMLDSAKQILHQQQSQMPVIEQKPEPTRQRRRLRQT